jgi:UDP-glucose 4-epimerase
MTEHGTASAGPAKICGKRAVITGGAGFIGTKIAERLVADNEVVVVDNLSRNSLSGSTIADHLNLRLVVGDVLDEAFITAAIEGADLLIHCAGIAGIDTVVKQPVQTMLVNMVGSANVLAAAAKHKVGRTICFSTSEVFGSRAFGSTETDLSVIGAAGEARWTYAVSKLAEEHLALAYHRQEGLHTTVLRPFNVYGPGQVGEGAVRNFVRWAIANQPIEIHGDGAQIRAWCYIDDMVDAVLLAASDPRAVGEAFNIGNRRSVETILGLANTVVRVLDSRSEIVFLAAPSADIELRIPSVDKARQLLNFEARVDLQEGIRRTAEYFRSIGDTA